MLKAITSSIAALFRTVEKAANTVENTVDLVDREVKLLERRQEVRMAEITHELNQTQAEFMKAIKK